MSEDDTQWGINWGLLRTIEDAPAEARGTGDIAVGTSCEWREDGRVKWRGEVTESADGEWLAILHRVSP